MWRSGERRGPRKLPALDGGGIRGALTLEILAVIDAIIRAQPNNKDAVLADYFDYIAAPAPSSPPGFR